MHRRRFAYLFAVATSLAGAQTAPDLDALLAARPALDTRDVREKLLEGDMPDYAADLLARTQAATARRYVLLERLDEGVPTVLLLVDDGAQAHVYRRSVSIATAMGYDSNKLVREVPAASAERLWRAFQAHAVPPASPASTSILTARDNDLVGIARLHEGSTDRWRLLVGRDVATYEPASALDNLVCGTLLAGLHCHPGHAVTVPEWLAEWMATVSTLRSSKREQRDDALWVAVRAGDWTRAKQRVDAGADPNAFASDGDSLAHWLAARHDPDAAAHLALLGADPEEATFFGDKPDALAH